MISSSGSSIKVTPSSSSTICGSGSRSSIWNCIPTRPGWSSSGAMRPSERAARGVGKPETFDFLGFTHICGKGKGGQFWLKRITISKRLRAKLKQVKDQLKRRRHLPIPEQGKWLASRGARTSRLLRRARQQPGYQRLPPPGGPATGCTRCGVAASATASTWKRMDRLLARWLPPSRILHPYPEVRFDVRTQGRSPVR